MTAKILVVDDEPDVATLMLQKFRHQIREAVYAFFFASNGQEALELLDAHPDIDFVLSDINMPQMDGLTLLLHLRERNPLLKTVIISAYGDLANIRLAMNRGAFDFITKPIDFADLEITMEKTLEQVRQIRANLQALHDNRILKLYVDDTVLQFMRSSEGASTLLLNETIEATVVFIDICGFTAITERAPADTVVRMLNRYFDTIAHEVSSQNGQIDKFMGDAVMAVFRGDRHLVRAVDCCLAVRQAITALQSDPQDAPFFWPQVAIGLNSGEMISGNIGSSALQRLDYTVIGDSVNLAQRLQSVAQPGQILTTQAVRTQLANTPYSFHPMGEVHLKNRTQPQVIFEIR